MKLFLWLGDASLPLCAASASASVTVAVAATADAAPDASSARCSTLAKKRVGT